MHMGPKIGVLALQGAVREHVNMLLKCGATAYPVKWPADLDGLDGLVIPGGESTAIGKLIVRYGFDKAIRKFRIQGKAIYGTCAGLIILAKQITEGNQPLLGLMDIEARRNAYGRQIDSFEADLFVADLGPQPFRGVFIRAPWIERTLSPRAEVLAEHEGRIVAARQDKMLVTAFHPELTDDTRVHELFLRMIEEPGIEEKLRHELGAGS